MRKLIEYTLISANSVFENPMSWDAMSYRDEAYIRDGLGLLMACDAMLMGRLTYEGNAMRWPGRAHPWADRLNSMLKYVFSSTLESATWNNSTIIRGDAGAEVAKLKQQDGGNFVTWGHGLFAEALHNSRQIDQFDVSIHPVIAAHGKRFFGEGQSAKLKLVASKTFSNIVKLTYEPQY